MTELEQLRQAIRQQHGVDATHLRSDPVRLPIWDGVVEVFAIAGHGRTNIAYAWTQELDDGERRHVAVLRLSPVLTASAAVREATMADTSTMRSKR
jgi:hypothetical protein